MEITRRIVMYVQEDLEPDDVERWAARYGFIVANPKRHGYDVTLVHPDGTEFTNPPGTQIWVSELVASEHDHEEAS